MPRTTLPLLALLTLSTFAFAEDPIDVGSRRELFVEDTLIQIASKDASVRRAGWLELLKSILSGQFKLPPDDYEVLVARFTEEADQKGSDVLPLAASVLAMLHSELQVHAAFPAGAGLGWVMVVVAAGQGVAGEVGVHVLAAPVQQRVDFHDIGR